MKTPMNRRRFFQHASAAAGTIAWTASSWAQVAGSNEEIRVAVIGFNGRGRDHIEGFRKVKGVRLVALCDVDRKVLDTEAARLDSAGIQTTKFADVRQLLERKDVDVVSIAAPNHWHSLMGIWACQAGKDVYVEKPVSHNVWEGRQLVNASHTCRRIVQAGTQSRSSPALHEAVAYVRSGAIGKIKLARGFCYKPRQSIGKVSVPTPIPDHIDYDLWCGPAPKHPVMRKKLHYDWHWIFETGNGDVGNQGIHQMDIARWFLGEMSLSPRILSVGGRLGYSDDGNTPNTQVILHDYAAAPLIFEVRGLPKSKAFQDSPASWAKNMPDYRGAQIGVIIECEGGWVRIPNYESATVFDSSGKEIQKFNQGGDHYANFIAAVRSRKTSDLHAPILEGHLSSALCHTGNISHRLGERLSNDAIRDQLKDKPGLAESFARMTEHLQLNEVDLNQTALTLGTLLNMDPSTELFIKQTKANQLLREECRPPFAVPTIVA